MGTLKDLHVNNIAGTKSPVSHIGRVTATTRKTTARIEDEKSPRLTNM